jgi:hypothetical protein
MNAALPADQREKLDLDIVKTPPKFTVDAEKITFILLGLVCLKI